MRAPRVLAPSARGHAIRLGAWFVGFVLLAATLAGCDADRQIADLSGETMGTTWSVKITDARTVPARDLQRRIEAELDLIVDQMSTWAPSSIISRYNSAAANTWHDLPDEFRDVLSFALSLADDTGGAYDPTVGPLVNVWGFGPDGERREPPASEQIEAARKRVGWRQVRLDRQRSRVHQPGGVYLDLSSIAKGYAVDRVATTLDNAGVESYLIEIGGELRARGRKSGGEPWRVAVEMPSSVDRDVSEILELDDRSVATSGDYRIHFESGGRRYSHTIDPRTGFPVDHSLVSVTVVHRDCMRADALATALSVLGPDEGFAFAERNGLAALFIERRGDSFSERVTPAFDAAVVHR